MAAQVLIFGDARLGAALDGRLAAWSSQLTGDAAEFGRLVRDPGRRPRVVVCASPPGTVDEIQLVLSERRRRPSLRALLVNPAERVTDRLEALAGGFDDAVSATIDADELAGRISVLLARASRPVRGRASIALGPGLELDLDAQELRRDGEPLHLRPKELRLLTVLATHPGRVYTRRQLLDRVWGSAHEGDQRTVDVHMAWLRAKLEPDPDRPVHIVTVRGIGYRLDLDRAFLGPGEPTG
jgi:DNA-binding response OmpR family regulator